MLHRSVQSAVARRLFDAAFVFTGLESIDTLIALLHFRHFMLVFEQEQL